MWEEGFLFFALLAALVTGEDVTKTALIGDSVMLECPIASQDGAGVRWVDLVYNTDHNPQVIANNGVVNTTHPQHENYEVNAQSMLKIITVSEEDAGEYRCERAIDSTNKEVYSYYLNTLGRPSCSGDPSSVEGSTVSLKCETPFSGASVPEMTWYRIDEHNTVLKSTDQFSIQLARRDLELTTTGEMDTTQVGCKVKMGEQEAECSVTLEVQYAVQNITVEPDMPPYPVGEPIRCAASGNPAAEVKWSPADDVTTEGQGWSTIVPNPSLEGSKVTLTCTARNEIDGTPYEITKEITFEAKEPLEPKPEPPKEEESKDTQAEPDSPASSSSEDSTNILPIVGGILGGIIVLAIICAIVIGIKKKKVPTATLR